jgi:hypothetical protein
MTFHWVALITLWTMFTGPIFGQPARLPPRAGNAAAAVRLGPAAATGLVQAD